MKKFLKLLRTNAVLIFFLSILVPSFAYVRNFIDTPIGIFLRTILVSILLFILFLFLFSIFFKDQRKLIVFTSLIFILFYLYGAIYDKLADAESFLGHHKALALLYLVLIISLFFLIKKIKVSKNALLVIKIIAIGFFLIQVYQLTPKIIARIQESKTNTTVVAVDDQFTRDIQPVSVTEQHGTPDVYYILLDTYARNDLIKRDFAYDNSEFTNSLEEKGFFVADCSRSNYMLTKSSLASSLNLAFLQDASDQFTAKSTNTDLLKTMIQDASIFHIFGSLGYTVNTFETGYEFTEIRNVGNYLQPEKPIAFFGSLQPFEILLVKLSFFKVFYDTHIPVINDLFDKLTFPFHDHVKLQEYIFNELVEISSDPEPTFTFAHVIIPHTPFIYRADGSFTTDRRYFSGLYEAPMSNELFNDGYINQVEYVNQKVLAVVEQILSNSETPPVIIIQGDHGVIIEDRLPILNAYYFPELDETGLYPNISPVNSFRLLLKNYFDTSYELLPDNSYTSTYQQPYNWIIEPEAMERCTNQ